MKTTKEFLNLKNVPVDITVSEYMKYANPLYSSYNAMVSENECYHFICLSDKKIYMFDSITEKSKISEMAGSKDFALLNIINK